MSDPTTIRGGTGADARPTGIGVLVIVAGASLLTAAWVLASDAVAVGRGGTALFVAAVALGELIVIDKPRGRPVPVALAVIATFALLGNGPTLTVLVAVAGWIVAAAVRVGLGAEIRSLDLVGRVSFAGAASGAAALAAWLAPGTSVAATMSPDESVSLVAIGVLGLLLVFGWPYWEAVDETVEARVRIWPVFLGVLEAGWSALAALAASAGLAALVHGVLEGWAVLLMLLPLLAARSGLGRHALVRRTYDQTVRAMSRLPELVGAVSEGHGLRVGRLAVEVARELALTDNEVAALERAAHLHELGAIARTEPHENPAFAGAAVVREAGNMPAVVTILERHRDPYRLVRQGEDLSVPMGARILRTVCEFDGYSHPGGPGRQPWDALERLHLGMAYEHDPVIIQALTRVLSRLGRI